MRLELPLGVLFAFLMVLARVSGVFAFFPGPMLRPAGGAARAVLVLAVTLALYPAWPRFENRLPSTGALAATAFAEAGFGLTVGLALAFLLEAFQVAMQIVGLQAGYGYSLTIDPASQADAGILQVMMMLTAGLLFFTLGLDREVLRVLAASLERFPAGAWAPRAASLEGIVALGGGMFSLALRLAFPVIALLLLLDVALALLGRMQQQLQLLSLMFPVKMLAALAILAVLAPLLPRLFQSAAERTLTALWRLLAF
jgi:flagellar biosynthetic protein FliR